ncbi:N-acetylmuramoyl-L-alanine amidase [Kineococcus sp. NPDC059986]|uniref:N-acetylmuramoyl-L-alanine amidase n=1 Tax=Kineococcus sp. NPDC059986 TaxID=3155538 RepID=UPI00344E490E
MPSPTPSRATLSRRAALAGAGGALAAVAGSTFAGPAVAAVPAQLRRVPGAGGVTSLPLPSVRSLLAAGSPTDLAVVSLPVDGGSMLGVTFTGPAPASVAVRVTRPGTAPGAWVPLALEDGTTDPVWTGALAPGTVVDVRLPRQSAAGARLAVVDPGPDADPVAATRAAQTLSTTAATTTAAGVGAPAVRSRAEWGADESLRLADPEVADTLHAAVVHHTADGGSYSRAEVPAVIRGMYRYHTQTLGWNDLGYNFVVDRFGQVWEGRAGGVTRPVVGAHAGGFNSGTVGVSMMGDFSSVAPTSECLASVAAVIAWKFALHDLDARGRAVLTSAGGGTARYAAGRTVEVAAISAHRDLGFTACPGDVGYGRMGEVRDRVAALLGSAPRSGGGSAVARKYAAVDGPTLLGAPTSEEGEALRGGRFRHYERGSIYHHPDTGTHVVRGSHREKYAAVGWEWSALGFPTEDTTDLPALVGSFTHFEHGSVYRRSGSAPHVVLGAIRGAWAAQGWERSRFGFPVSDEYDVPGGRAGDFEGGGMRWNASTGRVREV